MVQVVSNFEVLTDRSYALGVAPGDWVDAKVLAASTAEYVNVPTGAKYVIFSSTDDFYVKYNAVQAGTSAATVPADTADGTACELNPTVRFLRGITELSLISEGTPKITMRFYR
jgi:hypothetical protein